MKNKNMVPAVDKALSIIEYMCSMERPVTQAEICKGVDVSATTGYRIVQSLMKHNWIRKNRSNTYSLSIGMISVLMRSQKNGFLFDAAQTVLDELAEETKLTCKLSIRQWNEQVAVLRADSPEPFAVGGKNGIRFPVIEGSVGAALLAGESDEDIRALVEETSADIAEKRDPLLLSGRIAEVREKGWIFNRGNSRWRVDALSMPLRDPSGSVVAALTLLGIQDDFTGDNLPERVAALKRAAGKIESEL